MQAIWGVIWKSTVGKSQTNATNAITHLFRQEIWGNIWKHTMGKSQTNATNATMQYASAHVNSLRRHLAIHYTVEEGKTNVYEELWNKNSKTLSIKTSFASFYASALRTHLKTHSGEKSNKCNLCDYASSEVGKLKRHLKRHSEEKSKKCNHPHRQAIWGHIWKHTVEKK